MQESDRASGVKVVAGIGIAAGLLLLLIAFWPLLKAAQSPAPSSDAGGPGTMLTLKVDGMTCPTCSYRVSKALVGLPGVKKAEVSLERGQAVVEYEESKVTVDQMVEAIKQAGYSAELVAAGG